MIILPYFKEIKIRRNKGNKKNFHPKLLSYAGRTGQRLLNDKGKKLCNSIWG